MYPIIFPCPECGLLCANDTEGLQTRCRHCGKDVRAPEDTRCPPQYQVENVDFRYELSDLLDRIERGWEAIRELASKMGISVFDLMSKLAKPTRRLDERVRDGLREVIGCDIPGGFLLVDQLVNLTYEITCPKRKRAKGSSGLRFYKDKLTPDQRLEVCRQLANALTRHGNVLECLSQVFSSQTLRRAMKDVGLGDSNLRPVRLSENARLKLSWILEGSESHDACDEAWWKCVTLETKVAAAELLTIGEKVEREGPIAEDDHACLNEYLANANPLLIWRYDEDGSGQYVVKVNADLWLINRHPMTLMAIAFLIQPAYALARQMEDWSARAGKRHVVTCRNPHCARTFYSAREDAVACPKNRYKRVTSPCKREWDKYKRWLEKTRHDPEIDWNRQEVRDQYLPA